MQESHQVYVGPATGTTTVVANRDYLPKMLPTKSRTPRVAKPKRKRAGKTFGRHK